MASIAYSYARFSNSAQAEGDSLRRQLAASQAYADAHGLLLDTSLQDTGVSAYSGAHRKSGSALSSFLESVEKGTIAPGSFLLVDSFDRLTRERVTEALHLLTGITLSGVRVVTLNDGRVYDSTANMMELMFALMQFSRAHEESAEKGRKVAQARAEGRRLARENLRPFTKMGPHWLELIPDPGDDAKQIWRPIPERVEVVRRIFRMKEEGLGHSSIAAKLNDDGVPTPREKSGWTEATVGDLIKSRAVLGEYQPGRTNEPGKRRVLEGDPIPGFYPPIIDLDQFNRVETIVAGRRNSNARPRRKSFPNLLVGLVTCEVCGGTAGYLQSTFPKKPNWNARGVIRCNRVYTRPCTNRTRIPYDDLEKGLLQFVSRLPLSGRPPAPSADLLVEKEAEKDATKRKVEALLDQVEAGASIGDRLREREIELVKLEREIEILRARASEERATLPMANAKEMLQQLEAELSGASGEAVYAVRARINEALRRVVKGFVLSSDGQIIVRVHPNKVAGMVGSWRLPENERRTGNPFLASSDASGGVLSWEIATDHHAALAAVRKNSQGNSEEMAEDAEADDGSSS